jgi:hypothetical protein
MAQQKLRQLLGFADFFAGFRALNLSSVQLKNTWFEIECLEIFCQRLWGGSHWGVVVAPNL